MRIVPIISGSESLFAVHYDGYVLEEFRRLFENWTDTSYLWQFFHENIEDLHRYELEEDDIEELADAIRNQAYDLERELHNLARNKPDQLQQLFRPLDNREYELKIHQLSKAYGIRKQSWLRVYAIRLDAGTYIITGGAIKLTHKMEDREHTQRELNKLHQVRDLLREQGIADTDDLEFLEL